MYDRQLRALDSHEGRISGVHNGETNPCAEALVVASRLAAIVAEVQKARGEQMVARLAQEVTQARRQLEQVRAVQMIPLSRLCRRLFRGEGAIEAALAVPHKRAPSEEILAAIVRMVRALKPHRALLRDAGIDPARLNQLSADAKVLKKALSTAYSAIPNRAVPTRRIAALMREAHYEAMALDALMLVTSPPEYAFMWKGRRVKKKLGRPRKSSRSRTPPASP